MAKNNRKHNLPGTIYKNGNRYWWKVKLPGEEKSKARPLRPVGSSMATSDFHVAVECAKIIMSKAVLKSEKKFDGPVTTVGELTKVYLEYVDEYYVDPDGKNTKEILNIRYSLRPMIELFSLCQLDEFGPLKLIEVRDCMIAEEIVRKTINQRIGRIKRMFKWAVTMQIISPVIFQALAAVEGLKRGRTTAKEGGDVKPIDEKHVYMVLDYTTPVIAAMIELQLRTGMRPGEVVLLKPKDIDRSGEVWHYYPEKHKNEFRGHDRIVSIGPKSQKLLRPFLLRNEDSYCFSPAESEKIRKGLLSQQRKTPLSCGNRVGTNRKERPKKQPGKRYYTDSYRKAVIKAIKAAREDIEGNSGDPNKQLPKWTPNQLRHTAATKTRKIFNYEAAGAVLGHSNMSATAIYAERNQGLADDVAMKFG